MTTGKPTVAATDPADNPDLGMRILAEMLAGILLYGGLGYLGDRYFHTSFLVVIGIVVGLGLSMYLVFRRFKGMKA